MHDEPLGVTDLGTRFLAPPREFSPVPIWWWSGEELRPDRLRWQMDRLVEGGIFQAVVLNLAPNGPLYGALADRPAFFSEAWWDLFRGVCDDAAERGFSLWFYDQLGFSGADIQGRVVARVPACRGQALRRLSLVIEGSGTLVCPEDGRHLAAWVVPIDDDDRATQSARLLTVDGDHVSWSGGQGRFRLSLVYVVSRGFDYLSPAACQELLGAVHGQFDKHVGSHLGTTIVGSFQDELPSMPSWSSHFVAEFRTRRGYDIEPRLPALWDEDGDASAAVRIDYQRTRAELAEEAFFKPLAQWHEERGLLLGCDQQHPARAGYPLEATQQYADYPGTQRWYSAPGSDHWGDAKIHSSLAHLHDRPRTWVEAFHSTGWGGTLEETWDWLLPWLRAGANLYSPHAVYYATVGGHWEWAPPSTCWRQPYWRHHALFAQAAARLCATLTWGHHVCDVAVLYPTTSAQADVVLGEPEMTFGGHRGRSVAHDVYLDLVGRMHWFEPEPGVLDRDRRDFDVVDDESLARGDVDDDAWRIGHERYRAILVPASRHLAATTVDALARFAEHGGVVVLVGTDHVAAAVGEADSEPLDDRLLRLVDEGVVRAVRPEDVSAALADVPRAVDADTSTLLRSDGESAVLLVLAAAEGATVQPPDRAWLTEGYSFDPGRYALSAVVTIEAAWAPAVVCDPGTGEISELVGDMTPRGLRLEVPLDGGPCALVVTGPAAAEMLLAGGRPGTMASVGSGSGAPTRVSHLDEGGWSATVLSTMDNRWGDLGPATYKQTLPVLVSTIEHHAGGFGAADVTAPGEDAEWTSVRPTHGVWGWASGPAPATELVGPDDPVDVSWHEVSYSMTEGAAAVGVAGEPKGYVPEDFLDLGQVDEGDGVHLRFLVRADSSQVGHLTVGSNGDTSMWWNGERLEPTRTGHHAAAEVEVRPGGNALDLRVVAASARRLRASWSLRDEPEPRPRPDWITVAAEDGASGGVLRRSLHLPGAPTSATLQFGSIGDAVLVINGVVAARHGEFDNYAHERHPRVRAYDVTTAFRSGANDVVVEVTDPGVGVVIDAEILAAGTVHELVTNSEWEASCAGLPSTPGRLVAIPYDPRWVQLSPRVHTLPRAGRRQGIDDDAGVIGTPSVMAAGPRVEWFRFHLPPGATALDLPVDGDATAYVDGQPCDVVGGRHRVPSPAPGGQECLVRVVTDAAGTGGALWRAPIEVVELHEGAIGLGDWSGQGLVDHSGGVRYRCEVASSGDVAVLDLGSVRGTVDVSVNGSRAGVRIWSPYRVDVRGLFVDGDNVIEVEVHNTLAPHLAAVGSTRGVLPGQCRSGLFGPVRLLHDSPL